MEQLLLELLKAGQANDQAAEHAELVKYLLEVWKSNIDILTAVTVFFICMGGMLLWNIWLTSKLRDEVKRLQVIVAGDKVRPPDLPTKGD